MSSHADQFTPDHTDCDPADCEARSRPEIKKRPEVWTVTDPYAGTRHDFETSEQAMAHAASVSRSDRATVVTDPESVRVVVMRVDPRVTLQAVRNLTGPAVRPVQPPEPAESSLQALAGARLFYALYHHPEAKTLLTSGPLSSTGFVKAYIGAQRAFLPAEVSATYEDLAEPVVSAPEPTSVQEYRNAQGAFVPGPLPGETFPGPVEAYRKGRTDAADAIRQQARMYAQARGDEGGTLIDAEEAARLAEGSMLPSARRS